MEAMNENIETAVRRVTDGFKVVLLGSETLLVMDRLIYEFREESLQTMSSFKFSFICYAS